ncbi:MAG TPA: calcium-binding protein [Myxococcaceae bacterium]|nr:calcium-binding protein [Myxococcaceae bacterium]
MNRTTPYRRLLTAALCLALPLGGVACNASPEEADLAVGEAAAYLSASEESGDIGGDAVADASAETLGTMVSEDLDTATEAQADASALCDFSARRQEVLEKYDTSHDGKLDRAELRVLKGDLDAQTNPRFARTGLRLRRMAFWRVRWAFDENGDRVLSTEERTAMVDAMEARCQRLRQQVLEKYDTNQDGTLDETERQAAHQARLAAWQQKRQALLAQYDTNKDGRLSTEEALPLRQELQRRIIEGHNAD